jgi:hypothetical protein
MISRKILKCVTSGHNVFPLNPADFSKITPATHPFIFHFAELFLLQRGIILGILQKRLHIFDTSLDVAFDPFYLRHGHCKRVGFIGIEVIFDDLQRLRRKVPFFHSIEGITAKLDGQIFREALARFPVIDNNAVPFLYGAVNYNVDLDAVEVKRRKFLHFKPSFFAVGFQAAINVRSVEVFQAGFDILRHFFPLRGGNFYSVLMLEEGTGLRFFPVDFGSGRPKLIPHLVKGDGDNLFHREDFDASPNIADASVNAMMDLFSSPGLTVLQVLQDINLPGSFGGILEPAIPEPIIGKPVLSGAGFKGFIPAFGPGEFVLESGHRSGNLCTEAAIKPILLTILHRWGKISSLHLFSFF